MTSTTVVVLIHVPKLFDAPPFKMSGVILLPLNEAGLSDSLLTNRIKRKLRDLGD